MLVRIKGIKRYRSKGKLYHYHRATGARIESDPDTASFVAEVERLDAKAAKKAAPGTIGSALTAYCASTFFQDLAPATQVSYERAFKIIRRFETLPLHTLTTAEIVEAQEAVLVGQGRWMANYFVTVLAVVLKFARRRGWLKENPANDIGRIGRDRRRPRANRPWATAETRAVLDAAPAYLAVPIGLAMFAGFRKGDVLSLTWAAIVAREVLMDGVPQEVSLISHCTAKRRVDVAVPIHPTLANILSHAPPHPQKTIAATSRGKPWTESGFNSSFGKLISGLEKAGKVGPGLTMHGLRHTVATRLKEAGADKDLRKKLLGHTSDRMADHYSDTADVTEQAVVLVGRMKV